MRELPVEAIGPDSPEQRWARIRVLYTMIFPEDERARNEAICTMAADTMGRHQLAPEELVKRALALDGITLADIQKIYGDLDGVRDFINSVAAESLSATARGLFMPHGGFSSVAHAKGVSHVKTTSGKQLQELAFAGYVLRTIYRMAIHPIERIRGGASLKKAFFLLDRYDHGLMCNPKSESKMREVWDKFKNVAHLGAALLHITEERNFIDEDCVFVLQEAGRILSIAKAYQDFGLGYYSSNTKPPKALLDEDTLWKVPEECQADPSLAATPLPLSAQTILLAYKAPQHYDR